jgi:hypothetical protein
MVFDQKGVAWKRVSLDPATFRLLVDAVAVAAKVVNNSLLGYHTMHFYWFDDIPLKQKCSIHAIHIV